MPRGWAGCCRWGTGDTGVGSACGDPSGCREWVCSGCFAQVLLITFCWQLMVWDEEGPELEVFGERLLWGRAGHGSSQQDPLPVLGLFKNHPGAQSPVLQTGDGPWSQDGVALGHGAVAW